MYRFKFISLLSCLLILLSFGCSSSTDSPLTPSANPTQDKNPNQLWGAWTMNIDMYTKEIEIVPLRNNAFHLDVLMYMPFPGIKFNSFDIWTQTLDLDVTLSNPTILTAYDVRLILFSDSVGRMIKNADAWTPLYDIEGGNPLNINLFKAYGDIAGNTESTQNIQLYLPWFNFIGIKFAVDVSLPLHCEEPYAIENFVQDDWTESSSHCTVEPKAWFGGLVTSVELICDDVTSVADFNYDWFAGEWELDLENEYDAPSGTYTGWIKARTLISGDLALYQMVEIDV